MGGRGLSTRLGGVVGVTLGLGLKVGLTVKLGEMV